MSAVMLKDPIGRVKLHWLYRLKFNIDWG